MHKTRRGYASTYVDFIDVNSRLEEIPSTASSGVTFVSPHQAPQTGRKRFFERIRLALSQNIGNQRGSFALMNTTRTCKFVRNSLALHRNS